MRCVGVSSPFPSCDFPAPTSSYFFVIYVLFPSIIVIQHLKSSVMEFYGGERGLNLLLLSNLSGAMMTSLPPIIPAGTNSFLLMISHSFTSLLSSQYLKFSVMEFHGDRWPNFHLL